MKNIFVGLSTPNKKLVPISWAIRWIEKTDFSHAFVSWYSEKFECEMIYEASPRGVNFVSGPNHKVNVVKKFEIQTSEENFNKLIAWCIKNSGRKYGYKDILFRLFKKIGLVRRIEPSEETQVCVEVVGRLLNELQFLDNEVDFELLGLKELEAMLERKARRVI